MKVSENLSIIFFVERPEMSKDGRAPIYARITLLSRRSELSLGIRIFPDQWDKLNNRVKGKNSDVLLMNNQITQVKANLEKNYFLLSTQYEYVTADTIRRSYQVSPFILPLKKNRTSGKPLCRQLPSRLAGSKKK